MIELLLESLKASLDRNNELLEQVIAASGTTAAPAPEAKPAKAKAEPKAKVEPAPEPPADEDDGMGDEPAAPTVTVDDIRACYRERSAAAKDPAKFKAAFAKLKTAFNMTAVTDLKPEQLPAFLANLQGL